MGLTATERGAYERLSTLPAVPGSPQSGADDGTMGPCRRSASPTHAATNAGPITLEELSRIEVASLAGVGATRTTSLRAMGIENALDLLTHYPRRYIDRTNEARVADLVEGEEAMVLAEVRRIDTRRIRGGKTMVTGEIGDASGRLKITFFNQPWRQKQLTPGTEAVFFGKLESFRGARQMTNPVVDLIGNRTGRILPVYPQSEKAGLSTWELGELVGQVLRRSAKRTLGDPVPPRRAGSTRPDRRANDAFRRIHDPEAMAQVEQARRRLVFDELLRIQLALVQRKRDLERSETGIAHQPGPLVDRFLAAAALRAHRRPGPGDRRDPQRPRAAPADAPPAAGRRRRRQDGGGAGGAPVRGRRRSAGRADGAD